MRDVPANLADVRALRRQLRTRRDELERAGAPEALLRGYESMLATTVRIERRWRAEAAA